MIGYFLPTVIVWFRRHPNGLAIYLLNLFLGWTLIGWVIALVWSCTSILPRTQGGRGSVRTQIDPDWIKHMSDRTTPGLAAGAPALRSTEDAPMSRGEMIAILTFCVVVTGIVALAVIFGR